MILKTARYANDYHRTYRMEGGSTTLVEVHQHVDIVTLTWGSPILTMRHADLSRIDAEHFAYCVQTALGVMREWEALTGQSVEQHKEQPQ